MPIKKITHENLDNHKARIGRLSPESERRFGTLTVSRMLRHLRHTIEASIGEVETPDNSIPLWRTFAWFVSTYVVTRWPAGRIKAPPYWNPDDVESFEEERKLLLAALDRFVAALETNPGRKTIGNIIGPTSVRRWSRIHAVHFNHHLRQFGV